MASSFICVIIVRIIVSVVFTSHLTKMLLSNCFIDSYMLCGVGVDTTLTPHSISRVVSCGVREVSDVTHHSM